MVRLWLGLCEEWNKDFPADNEDEDVDEGDEEDDDVEDVEDDIDGMNPNNSSDNKKNSNNKKSNKNGSKRERPIVPSMTPETLARSEAYQTARAAAGTLAVASSDSEVCQAMIEEGCVTTIISLLESEAPELVHRCLVCIQEMVTAGGQNTAKFLLEGGVVPAIAVVVKMGDATLGGIARNTTMALSAALKPVTAVTVNNHGNNHTSNHDNSASGGEKHQHQNHGSNNTKATKVSSSVGAKPVSTTTATEKTTTAAAAAATNKATKAREATAALLQSDLPLLPPSAGGRVEELD